MVQLSKMQITRYIPSLALLTLVFLGLFAACAGSQQTQNPAGTSTQDPLMPQFTEATHGRPHILSQQQLQALLLLQTAAQTQS